MGYFEREYEIKIELVDFNYKSTLSLLCYKMSDIGFVEYRAKFSCKKCEERFRSNAYVFLQKIV